MVKYDCGYCGMKHEQGTHPHNDSYEFQIWSNGGHWCCKLRRWFDFKIALLIILTLLFIYHIAKDGISPIR